MPKSGPTRTVTVKDVPAEYAVMFNDLADTMKRCENKAKPQMFADMVMAYAVACLGIEQAERSIRQNRRLYGFQDGPS